VIPVSILIDGGGGKCETVRLTGPPAEIVWPAAGNWRMTVFSGWRELVSRDIPAILSHTRDVVFLGDEEMAVITPSGVEFTDYSGRAVSKRSVATSPAIAGSNSSSCATESNTGSLSS